MRSLFKKLRFIFDGRQKRQLLGLLAAFVVGSALELIGVSAILPLASVISDPTILATNPRYAFVAGLFHTQDARSFLILACVGLIVVYVVKSLYLLFMYDLQFRFTYKNKALVSSELLRTYIHQDYLSVIDCNVAELQRTLTSDVEMFFALVLALLNIVCEAITSLALFLFLAVSSPVFTFAMTGVMCLFGLLFAQFYRRRLHRMGEQIHTTYAERTKWLLQSFGGIKEIKVMDREPYFQHNFDVANEGFSEASRSQSLNQVIARPVIETACIGGMLGIVAIQVAGGAPLSGFIPVLSVFAVAAMRLLPSFNRIMSNLSSVMSSLPGLDAVYADKQAAGQMHAQEKPAQAAPLTLNEGILLEDITFTYPHKEQPVLTGAALRIPKNSAVALVGPSGSGKTTLADILLGLIPPQGGRVLADGRDIYQNLHGWHELIGYIPQSIYLMDDTIRGNIAFGLPADRVDEARIWEVLRQAQLDDFVRAQPGGLDTEVGDRGVKLSGGQRQRIGIARALYGDPQVLVLDEATSALDSDTETAVMQAINSLQGSKTLILIAHRLSTIRSCDAVYEVRDGGIHPVDKAALLGGVNS